MSLRRSQGVRHHSRMKSPVFAQSLMPSLGGVSDLLALQEQHKRTLRFVEEHHRVVAATLRPLMGMTDHLAWLQRPSYLTDVLQTHRTLMPNLVGHAAATQAVQRSLVSAVVPTIKPSYLNSIAPMDAAFAAIRAVQDSFALQATTGRETLDQVRAALALVSGTGLPRSVTELVRNSPAAHAAGLWQENLQDLHVAPDATRDEVVAATTEAGLAAAEDLTAQMTRLFEAHQATVADQINASGQLHREELAKINARLDAAEPQSKAWLLKPEFLFNTALALLALLLSTEVMDFYTPRALTVISHVQQLGQQLQRDLWDGGEPRVGSEVHLYVVGVRPVVFHVRPHGPSRVTRRVAPGQTVVVVGRRGKWVKVAAYDPRAGDLVTGWCLKKYLHRPKAR